MISLRTVSSYCVSCVLRSTVLLLLPVLLSGCNIYSSAPPGSYIEYYSNPNKELADVGRIAIVELDNHSSYPAISTDITKSLFQTLQKQQAFGLTIVRQSDPKWRSLQLNLEATYTLEQLLAIQETLKCDTVLLGSVTEYQPYPHMAIGLQLKLVDLKDGQLIWALEQIWDSADKTTEYRIKNYFKNQIRSGFAPLSEHLVAVSSLKFINFVTYEVAETLQPKW